jgi:prolyl-tRNA synthetase
MKASQFFISTLKEAPAEAEVISHKLMVRAGLIKRLGAGIYTYMPMGLRVLRKVESIIRQEMDHAGAIELLMPVVQPAELWQETGRFDKMGPELLRVKDRHERDFIIQPTCEEVITDIARQELRSYRQFPKNFYHIQTKFRDERRPRFGVMRGREFTMKDAYSFDRDAQSAALSYDTMFAAYCRIFERLGLTYRAVAADTGAIGGDRSHEFQVIAQTGEDAIAYCSDSDFAANVELAQALPLLAQRSPATQPLAKVATPGKTTCEEVAHMMGLPLIQIVKSLVLATDTPQGPVLWLLLLRGDHELNEVKVGKLPQLGNSFRFASNAEIETHFGCRAGFIGPLGIAPSITVIADTTVARMANFVCGANAVDHHLTGLNWVRDLPEPHVVADIRNVVAGDPSPDGKGILAIERGIEVGHVFYLGTNYSKPLNATFLDETGKPQPMEMGCYGIGVSRILGAAIEQNFDDRGIIWPTSMAPFTVVICPIGYDRNVQVKETADQLHTALLAAGIDALLDDRGERPGAMFADWELLGVPHRIVLSERGLKAGQLEYLGRRDSLATVVEVDQAHALILSKLGQ